MAHFRLGWSHEYADTTRPVWAALAGAPTAPFTTSAGPQRDGVVVGVAANTARRCRGDEPLSPLDDLMPSPPRAHDGADECDIAARESSLSEQVARRAFRLRLDAGNDRFQFWRLTYYSETFRLEREQDIGQSSDTLSLRYVTFASEECSCGDPSRPRLMIHNAEKAYRGEKPPWGLRSKSAWRSCGSLCSRSG